MPWRLVAFIVILGLVVIFAGFNIGNSSDVSFGFQVVEDVPIFISLFFAFVVGVIVMTPFVVGRARRNRRRAEPPAEAPAAAPESPDERDVE